MPATEADLIKWWFKWLREESENMTEWEMNFCIQMEEKFQADGKLTKGQMNKLEEIYKART